MAENNNVRLVKLTKDSILSWGKRLFDFLHNQKQEDYGEYLLPLAGCGNDYNLFATRLSFLVRDQELMLHDNKVPTDYWIALVGSEIVGTAKTRYLLDSNLVHEGGHIRLGVSKDYRGMGCGKAILDALIERVKDHGLKDILLSAWDDNSAANMLAVVSGALLESTVPSRLTPGKNINLYWLHF